MAISEETQGWWIKTLLGESQGAHPIFGPDVKVRVKDDVVTLSGKVDSADQAEDLEQEAKHLAVGREVINHLTVTGTEGRQHLQTVIGIFPDEEQARMAGQVVTSWKWRMGAAPEIISDARDAKTRLEALGRAAKVPVKGVRHFVDPVRNGKALLIDRVPEDDAFRAISGLEGTHAEIVQTLPPEPDSFE